MSKQIRRYLFTYSYLRLCRGILSYKCVFSFFLLTQEEFWTRVSEIQKKYNINQNYLAKIMVRIAVSQTVAWRCSICLHGNKNKMWDFCSKVRCEIPETFNRQLYIFYNVGTVYRSLWSQVSWAKLSWNSYVLLSCSKRPGKASNRATNDEKKKSTHLPQSAEATVFSVNVMGGIICSHSVPHHHPGKL